jgi:hypothetical protein
VKQSRKPNERHGHSAAISEVNDQFVSGDADFDSARISFDGEGTHAKPIRSLFDSSCAAKRADFDREIGDSQNFATIPSRST